MKTAFIFAFIFPVVGIACWVTNLYSFIKCDFESPYRCEVIHGIGVFVPPAALVTTWIEGE